MKRKTLLSGLVIGIFFVLPTIAAAQPIPIGNLPNNSGTPGAPGNNTGVSAQLQNPIGFETIPQLVTALLNIVVKIGGPILVFFLVYVGFLFVMARGNPTELQNAKRALVYALIGGLMLLGAFTISEVICNTVGNISGQSASGCLI